MDNMQTEQLQSITPDQGFGALPIVLRLFCLLPFLTGAADLIWGTKILELGGAVLPQQVISDPTFNNQVKFWGAIWFGYGAALWWTSSRLRSDTVMFRILIGTLFLSGLGRALSVFLYGWSGTPLTAAMTIELLGPMILWFWHGWLLHKT